MYQYYHFLPALPVLPHIVGIVGNVGKAGNNYNISTVDNSDNVSTPYGDCFLRVLKFDISADWLKNVKFVFANMHYRTLEFVDPAPFSRTNCKI